MRSHLLSIAACALLSVFVVVSSPCLAESEEAGAGGGHVVDPAALPPNSDPTQHTTPSDGAEAGATIEEAVEAEDVPPSEE